ncbi:MAG: DUF302 domain-containing protein [Sulfuricurvum sp.]|uniref:DUF302 domain-containing protein n=1 Tax=Sulfuricurvum sp. TaxID=2025608 RepID=UPI002620D742|nr:DUF302 domain-containing protein [Sulfuricurvum sp.]MDD2829979.1 DUF302 domain-containing protein [Sulfuricurvum sp.]MDD4949084.1 DUF302 domain-containing protein [Sulfuricurvum sp.]
MKKIVLILLVGVLSLFGGDLHLISVPNADGKLNASVIEKALEANGFVIAADSEMNGPFTKQFGQSDFAQFNLLTAYHKKLADSLVRSHPDAGIFVPMGFGIYQRNGDKNLHVSILTAEAMAKIAGFKAKEFGLIEKEALSTLKKALPNAKITMSETSLPAEGTLLSRYVKASSSDSWKSDKDSTEMMIEEGLKPAGFVLSNFTDYNFALNESSVASPFDFYDTYSICKLKVIYTVAKTRPEAAAFAPCTLMVYKKKDANEIVMGFPGVYNWMSSARVSDSEAKAVLVQAQKDFEAVLQNTVE